MRAHDDRLGMCKEGCTGEQASLEFDLTFGGVSLHKLVQATMLRYTLYI